MWTVAAALCDRWSALDRESIVPSSPWRTNGRNDGWLLSGRSGHPWPTTNLYATCGRSHKLTALVRHKLAA